MKKNLSNVDRIIRVLISVVLAVLYFTHVTSGVLGIVLLIAAVVLLGTVLLTFCPIYWSLGLSTRKKE